MTHQETLEKLWTSTVKDDVMKFYELLESIGDFEKFSLSRKKPSLRFRKLRWEADREIIAVVPTADAFGPLARQIDDFYYPLPLILVESKGQFFNYSYSVNSGVREALKGNPAWIIVSNDDLVKHDDGFSLASRISKTCDAEYLLIKSPRAVSQRNCLSYTATYEVASTMHWDAMTRLVDRLFLETCETSRIFKKFGINRGLYRQSRDSPLERILNRVWEFSRGRYYSFPVNEHMGVYRSYILRDRPFDETFINDNEDTDFCFNLSLRSCSSLIEFAVGHLGGASLSATSSDRYIRSLRDLAGQAYFLYKNRRSIEECLGARSGI